MTIPPPVWRRPVASPLQLQAWHQQRRHKVFKRIFKDRDEVAQDEQDRLYYISKKPTPPKTPPSMWSSDIFEVSSLLLDLDAEGCRAVRPFTSEDEERLSALWAAKPAQKANRTRVRQLQDCLADIRRRRAEILTQTTSTSRLTSHDILATAFRGTSRMLSEMGSNPDEISTAANSTARRQPLAEVLAPANGIPPHAIKDDERLLKWMLLRHESLLEWKDKHGEAPPTMEQFSEALALVDSVRSLRRLVFQCLDLGMDITMFGHMAPTDSAQQLRKICVRLLSENDQDMTCWLEASKMIGNLSARLAKYNLRLSAPLQGLGLVVSAQLGAVDASHQYLSNGNLDNIWKAGPEASHDILSALEAYTFLLTLKPCRTVLGENVDRQKLLQLITGLDEDLQLDTESFRSLVMAYQEGDTDIPDVQALDVYTSYIMMLGHLGALCTLWKEWRVSAPVILEKLRQNDSKDGQIQGNDIANSFLAAFQAASTRASTFEQNEVRQDMDLEDCVTHDYHAMSPPEGEPMSIELREEPEITSKPALMDADPSILKTALESPLGEWLAKAKSMSRA